MPLLPGGEATAAAEDPFASAPYLQADESHGQPSAELHVTDEESGLTLPLRARSAEEARLWYELLVSAIREAKAVFSSHSGPSYSPFSGALAAHDWCTPEAERAFNHSASISHFTPTPSVKVPRAPSHHHLGAPHTLRIMAQGGTVLTLPLILRLPLRHSRMPWPLL